MAGNSPLSAPQLRQSVLVYNLPVIGEPWTPKAAAASVPAQISLEELRGGWSIRRDTTVFVCENPAVIEQAASRLGSDCMPLLCLRGYPNLAVEYLLLALGLSQTRIRVHTDHDLFGARIAQTLFHKLIDYELWCPKPSAGLGSEGFPTQGGMTEEECLPYMLNDLRR